MDPITLDFFNVIARWGLTLLFGYLVQHHVITAEQSETYVVAFAHKTVLYGLTLIPLIMGLCGKWRSRRKLLVATMKAGMSENEIKDVIRSGDPVPTVRTPANTVPGVPK